MAELAHLRRREFLLRCCQGASFALISPALVPSGLGRIAQPADGPASDPRFTGELHLRPHYRASLPGEATLRKTDARLDSFITEQYADKLEAILQSWTSALLLEAGEVSAFAEVFSPAFAGSSPKPALSRALSTRSAVRIQKNTFSPLMLGSKTFLQLLGNYFRPFSKLLTAEFQITSLVADSQAPESIGLHTRVRYELVGTGGDFYRCQRVGSWEISWKSQPSSDCQLSEWRWTEEVESRASNPVYIDIAPAALGNTRSFAQQLSHGSDYWRTVLDGACGIDIYGHNGISVGDIDGDGCDDLYVCQPGGLPNRLYRNRGDGTFEDITETSGVGVIDNTACALFVDIDNDGRQDLIVVRNDGPLLFLNAGEGKFREKANAFHFANPPQGTFTGAAVADYDRDGWLDIYFCLYAYYQGTGQYKYPSPYFDAENGPPNFLMRNHRDGTFRDVTSETGLNKNNTRYSFCCAWNDFNDDGCPDLYVVNDFGRKNLYRNNGDGTFTDIAPQAGVEDVGAGMGACWFDYDNDGAEDLYVANMWTAAGERISTQGHFQKTSPDEIRALYRKHAMGNSLFRDAPTSAGSINRFADRTKTAGVGVGRWAWACDSWDFDHDGFADLYITNGMISGPNLPYLRSSDSSKTNPPDLDLRNLDSRNFDSRNFDFRTKDLNSFFWRQVIANSPNRPTPSPDYEQGWSALNDLIRSDGTWSGYERNIFYANNGDGTFSDISGAIGLDFLEDGRSFALADFDLDGRLEIFLKNRNAPQLRILKNVMDDLPPSISFRLRGTKSNRDAIGAVVILHTSQGLQTRSLQAGSGFLSQHSKELLFGLGAAQGAVNASIRWPSGLVQELKDLPANHRVWIDEGSAPSRMEPFRTPQPSATFTGLAPQASESLPSICETWLLSPIAAPDFSLPDRRTGRIHSLSAARGMPVLLHFGDSADERAKKDWSTIEHNHAQWFAEGFKVLSVVFDDPENSSTLPSRLFSFPILTGSDDVAAIYNILFRYIFDRRRDIPLPASFLIDPAGSIVKIYQGPIDPAHIAQDFRNIPKSPADRPARALPFPGISQVKQFPRNYLSYGAVYFQRGYLDQSLASFQISLYDDPDSAEALYGMGSVYLAQHKNAEARNAFERTVRLNANYPDTLPNAWNNLGLLAAEAGHNDEAISNFQQAIQLSPGHLVAINNLAKAYRVQHRWDDARHTYERALQLAPDDPETNYGLGMVYAQQDDTARAFDYLQRALKSRPIYPEALNNLGILYLRTNRPDDAIAAFQQSIRTAPAFDQSYLNLARVYADLDQPAKARATLEDLLKQTPGQPAALDLLQKLKP